MGKVSDYPALGTPATSNDSILVVDDSTAEGLARLPLTGDTTKFLNAAGQFVAVGAVKFVNIVDYGASTAAGFDNSTAIANAISTAVSLGIYAVYIPPGVWGIGSSINLPHNVAMVGAGIVSELQTISTGSYTDGFMVRCNSSASGTTWDQAYPQQGGILTGLKLTNPNYATLSASGIFIADRRIVENIHTDQLNQTAAYTTEYLDLKCLRKILVTRALADTDYVIDSGSLGDGLHFDQISVSTYESTVADADKKAMKINATTGGSVTNCIINGQLLADQSDGLTFDHIHTENHTGNPRIIFQNCGSVALRNSHIQVGNDVALEITRDANVTKLGRVLVDNCSFVHRYAADGATVSGGDDISVRRSMLTIRDSYRRTFKWGEIHISNVTGLSVINGDTLSPVSGFNQRSFFLSRGCRIRDTALLDYIESVSGGNGTSETAALDLSITTTSTWTEPTGTYYYTAQLLYDVDRMLGEGIEEESITATNGAGSVTVNIDPSGYHEDCGVYRVYRGTASGSYDAYVDIPVVYGYQFVDTGTHLNALPWQARTAGVVDSLNPDMHKRLVVTRDSVEAYATTVSTPLYGTWARNDKVLAGNPTGGGPDGVICTLGGSPGSWTALT